MRDIRAMLDGLEQNADLRYQLNQDFITVNKIVNGRATKIDYYISLDMAKELSMVERT